MEGFELDIANSIDAGWPKWRQVRGVLCDHSLILQLHRHYCKITSRLALLYGAECWGWWNEELIYTCWNAQAKMLCDFTRKDRIRDEHSRGNLWIEGGKTQKEYCLRWFGDVHRGPTTCWRGTSSKHFEKGSSKKPWMILWEKDMLDWGVIGIWLQVWLNGKAKLTKAALK